MSTAQEAFKTLISTEIHPLLKGEGFKKKQFNFLRQVDGIWHVIQFQKSTYSQSQAVRFTINVSVFSEFLHEQASKYMWCSEVKKGGPTEPACQDRNRIGSLMPEGRDRWWDVTTRTNLAKLGGELRDALTAHALTLLEERRTNEQIRDAWIVQWREKNARRLELGVLLKHLGPAGLLGDYLDYLEGSASPRATGFLESIRKLRADC